MTTLLTTEETSEVALNQCELDLTSYHLDGETPVALGDFGVVLTDGAGDICWRSLQEMLRDEAECFCDDLEVIHGMHKLAKFLTDLANEYADEAECEEARKEAGL